MAYLKNIPGTIAYEEITEPSDFCPECGERVDKIRLGGSNQAHKRECSLNDWPLRVEYRISELERRIEALERAAEARDDG